MSNVTTKESVASERLPYPFTPIPNAFLQSPNISNDAKAVGCYLQSKPIGWEAHPAELRKTLNMGERAWARVSHELKALGILELIITRYGSKLIFHGLWKAINEADLTFCGIAKCRPLIKKESLKKKDLKKSYDHADEPVDKFTKAKKAAKEKIEGLKAKIKKNDFKRNKIEKEEEKKVILKPVAKRSKASPYAKSLEKGKRLDDYINAFSNDELKCYQDMIEMGVYKKEAIGIAVYHPIFEIVGVLDDMKKYKIDNKGAYLREALRRIREKRGT